MTDQSTRLFGDVPDVAYALRDDAVAAGEDTRAAIAAARRYGSTVPLPGERTGARWGVLAVVAASNLTAARALEPHLDALAILSEAGADVPGDLAWGVFAAEAPGTRHDASPGPGGQAATLTGTKAWCSLAGQLDAALVTAHTPAGRRLFAVDLRHRSVTPDPAQHWVARGLRTVTSAAVHFDATPATPVGDVEWYLTRPGFAWGGIGVAACWYGGAVGLLDRLRIHAADRGTDVDLLHLGAADVALHGARSALGEAARDIDAGRVDDAALSALRVRSVVADAAERVLRHASHGLGPAPLAFDADHAARVADLELYLRQHHGERDLDTLGRTITARS